ncbi:TPA: hypothetical protein N0F65_012940 [Lagenidium giganteum]|uniref:Importin N-terminal domain-containing protein n=1 Tax=Lagenidium giganteum TaxID=4803 RepID=A0AAV2Z4B8_9STRA|nr:TPA: hypothetical protein N0F65_012940 [Lagenidium giganteum]
MASLTLQHLLQGSLTAPGTARGECEAELTRRLSVPGFALQLTSFLFDGAQPCAAGERQFACLLLKKLVASHWTADDAAAASDEEEEPSADALESAGALAVHASASHNGYVVGVDEQTQVKQLLLDGARQSLPLFADSKLQTSLCMTMAAIFERDWPDQWPGVMPMVLEMVAASEALVLEFAIRFLTHVGAHFSGDNCCDVVRVVFPHLERLMRMEPAVPVSMRTRIVRIVQTSLLMVGMEAQVGNSSARELLYGNITTWIGLMLTQLALPAHATKDYGLKIQVLQTLTSFVREWPKNMADLLHEIMPQVYAVFAGGLDVYERDIILGDDADDDAYDSDGDGAQIGQRALVVAVFEFLSGTLHAPTKKTRQLVMTALSDVVYVMIAFMQITNGQMSTWEDDPNKYVADEDDQSLAFNVRNAATDLLSEVETVLGRKAVLVAMEAAQRRLKADGAPNWRIQEAALVVVGNLATPWLSAVAKSNVDTQQLMDVTMFLQTLFTVMNAATEQIYLRARALWCASRLVKAMDQESLDLFLQVAISGIDKAQMLPVRMYACRAIGAFLGHDAAKQRIQASSDVIMDRLTHLAEQATNETLHIALETMVVVLQEINELPIASVNAVLACFLGHWHQNLNDPLIGELVEGAFGALLEMDKIEIVAAVHQQLLPVVRTMLLQSKQELDPSGNGGNIAAGAITTLKTVLRHSFVAVGHLNDQAPDANAGLVREMSTQIVQIVFEPLVDVLQASDDERVLDCGAECLKWLVMFAVDALREFYCANGTSGIDATLTIAAKLLTPGIQDSSAVCVGGLITQILLKLGPALPMTTVQSILSAVGTRLATADIPSLAQSLCMVFARLVHSHDRELLNVLEQLPAPTVGGPSTPRHSTPRRYQTMLEFVFAMWIEKQGDFYGVYCIRVTTSALLKVLEWNDPRVLSIMVTGSVIESNAAAQDGAGVRTRAQSRASQKKQFTTVHFLTKLVLVLAKTLAQLSDEEEEWESSDNESDEGEDGDDSFVHQSNPISASSSIFAPAESYELSDRLDGTAALADDGEEIEEEFEAHFDPLNDIDLKTVLPQVLQRLTSDNTIVQVMLPELTSEDKLVLANVSSGSS